MDAACKAICQLPHSQWPIQVDLLPFSSPLNDPGKHKIQITQSQDFISLKQWLQFKFKMILSRDELTVPDRCIVSNSLSKFIVREQVCEIIKDPLVSRNNIFHFLGDKYDVTQLDSIKVDDHVFWPIQNLLLFGKVRFIGINRSTRFQIDDVRTNANMISVFVAFATTEYLFGKSRDWENGNHVYKVNPKELYTFQEINELNQKTRGLTVNPTLTTLDGSEILDFSIPVTQTRNQDLIATEKIECSNISLSSSSSSVLNAREFNQLRDEFSMLNHKSGVNSNLYHGDLNDIATKPDFDSSVTRPLEKMKVDKSLLEKMDDHDYNRKQNKEITSLFPNKIIDSVGEFMPYENTSVQLTDCNLVNINKSAEDELPRSSASLSATIIFPEGKSYLIGNCVAVKMGIKVLTGESEIKKGGMIVAVNKSIHTPLVGNVQLACLVNGLERNFGENCTFAGVRFARPLVGFDIFHGDYGNIDLVSGQCKPCEGNRLLFISLERIKNKNFDKEKFFHYMPVGSDYKEENAVLNADQPCSKENAVFVNEIIPINQYTRDDFSRVGIEGRSNSCYADSFLFALFAFTNVFDGCLERDKRPEEEKTGLDRRCGVICDIVKFDLATPLRRREKVGWRSMHKLRQQLGHYDSSCVSSVMDVEEFALILFEKGFQTKPFLEFDSDTMDYIYQIFVTPEDVKLSKGETPKLQHLLSYSFQDQMVKLVKTPSPAFIVKLPVSDGKPSFPKIFPNLEISLAGICEEKSSIMVLRTVICLRNSHFTCFVRASKDATTYSWLYFDSMTSGSSMVTEIPTLEEKLLQFSTTPQENANSLHKRRRNKQKRPDWIDKLLSSAYMCIYEPKNFNYAEENHAVNYEFTSDDSL